MPFEQLLGWARGRPDWQRDALRRLAVHGELAEDDLAALRGEDTKRNLKHAKERGCA